MKKIFTLLFVHLLCCCFSFSLFSQIKFQKTFGGIDSTQDGLDVKQTTDGGYIVNARVTTSKLNADCENAYLIKTDPNGIMQWSRTYAGSACEEGLAVIQTNNGGYLLAGETRSFGNGYFDLFLLNTNNAGAMQWTKTYGEFNGESAWAIQQTTDGGYAAFGYTNDFTVNGYFDYYFVKLDAVGNHQWSKTYGGTYLDFGYDARQTNDGGYIMTGSSYSFGGGLQMYMVKTDVNGTMLWDKVYGGTNGLEDYGFSVRQTTDGGYITCGGTQTYGAGNTDVFLVKTDSDGNTQWSKTYGGFNNDCGFVVRQTTDGGYAIAGATNSIGAGGYDDFLLKTDNAGTMQWVKTYGGSADDGVPGGMFFIFSSTDRRVRMEPTNDGGYVLTSLQYSFPGGNVYLIKTDSDGNSGCNETTGSFTETSPTPNVTSGGTQTIANTLTTNQTPAQVAALTTQDTLCPLCAPPTAAAGNDVTICQTASTTLTASGGTSYLWNTGATTSSVSVSPTSTTNYIVTVTDSCGSDKDTVVVTVNPLPTVTVGNNSTICAGATVTLNGTGTGAYVWNPGGQTTSSISVSPTATSSYTLSITNSCGTSSDSVKVTIASSITANISGNTSICSGASATLSASGGSTYSWSTTATTSSISVSPTSASTYSVIAYSGSCSDTTSLTVNVTQTPVAAISANTTICSGQSATLSASGGGNYSWSTTATTSSVSVSPTSSSTYSVIVSSGSCADTASASVTVNPVPNASISGSATICTGGSTTLIASGGNNYSWSTTATTSSIIVSPTSNATYFVIASNGNCSDTASVSVSVVSGITASITGNTVVCSGFAITLTASGGTNYSWSTGATTTAITIIPTASSSYSVIATNGNCSSLTSINVTVNPTPVITIPPAVICNGSNATLSAVVSSGTPAYSYAWLPGGQTTSAIIVNPGFTTLYSLQVTDANGCSASATTLVTVNAGPALSISGNTLLCTGDATTLTASGGISYVWNTGGTSSAVVVAPTSSTTYSVIGTSANLCTSASTVSVTVLPPPNAAISGNDTICFGDNTNLTASGGGNYLWNTSATTSSINVSPTSTTNYSVIVSVGSCKDSATYSVAVVPNPIANAGTSVSVSQGQSTTLTASGGGTYSWSNGAIGATNIVNPNSTTQYCVYVTDASGCTDTSCLIVYVKPMDCSDGVYVPNAFSPNEDNENDFFQVYFVNPSCVKYFKFFMYNRWGEKIFQTNDPGFVWDGSYPDMTQNSAVFTYYMYVQFTNGNDLSRQGNVSLVR
ncbi:MAG: gliding motility-associated C-terminal domain-containing protein [Bacteroidetes bacterium]|nr:gliding motility-associated C-terminal domain-containing protein [Bacteroidota bacterium]